MSSTPEERARIHEIIDHGIRVCLPDRRFFVKKIEPIYGDTFQWVVGPDIHEFFKMVDLQVFTIQIDDGDTEFFFPGDRKDAAALFKLTFS